MFQWLAWPTQDSISKGDEMIVRSIKRPQTVLVSALVRSLAVPAAVLELFAEKAVEQMFAGLAEIRAR